MSARLTQRQIAALPEHPTLTLTATARHASVNNQPVVVPDGVDPRAAAANAAIEHARAYGRPIRAILHDQHGRRWPLVITPDGHILTRDTPLPSSPAPRAPIDGGSDPRAVPPWPVIAILLRADGTASIDGAAFTPPPGMDPRTAAIAAAAQIAVGRGLHRAVRAIATDPDGTSWPLIIHPDGTASDGTPPTPAQSRRTRIRFRRQLSTGAKAADHQQEGR